LERAQHALGGPGYVDVIIGEVEGTPSPLALEAAVEALAKRHPVLRAWLGPGLGHGLTYGAAVWDPLPVDRVVGDWARQVEALLGLPWAWDGPLWRIVAVIGGARTHILLAVHHALVDGRSLSMLLSELLQALADPGSLGPPLPPPRPLLDLLSPPTWMTFAAPFLQRAWAWNVLRAQRRNPLLGEGDGSDRSLTTVFAHARLPAEEVAWLREEARTHDATVGGALVSAAWSSTRALVATRSSKGRSRLPISIEAMVDAAGDRRPGAPGMYASGVVALSGWGVPEDPWARAAAATQSTRRQQELGVPLLVHVVVDRVPHPAVWLRDRGVDLVRNGGVGALAQVSNVGPWCHPTAVGAHRLRAAWSATQAVRGGPALLVWLRTVDGVGCLSAIGNAAVVSREELDAWLAGVRDALSDMVADARARAGVTGSRDDQAVDGRELAVNG
jgi:hypothetical protein